MRTDRLFTDREGSFMAPLSQNPRFMDPLHRTPFMEPPFSWNLTPYHGTPWQLCLRAVIKIYI